MMLAITCTVASTAFAACPTNKRKTCVELNMTPTVSDQVITGDPSPLPPKIAPSIDNKPPYTGPTVGVSPTVHKTPTVGYRWAIN
jgi:hypothetical protein